MRKTALVVISDLHISAGELDDFDKELEAHFCAFLHTLSSSSSPCELVVNGDFLDFVQAPPWNGTSLESSGPKGLNLCFSEDQSLQKLREIESAHPAVFQALHSFLRSNREHRLVILPGNHDADLFWPRVRNAVRDAISHGMATLEEQLTLHLARVYRSPAFPVVWVEHGHQFDRLNRFFVDDIEHWSEERPPYVSSRAGSEPRLLECDGTLFLVRFLNRLDRDYPLVDNVKPFGLFVKLFAASAFDGVDASLQAAMSMTRLLAFAGRSSVTDPASLLSVDNDEDTMASSQLLIERLAAVVGKTSELDTRLSLTGFDNGGMPLALLLDNKASARRVLDHLATHLDLLDGLETQQGATGLLDLDGSDGTLSLAKGFWLKESDTLLAGARDALARDGVELVVMGHTHEALDRPHGVSYLNTGCWTRYYDHTQPEQRASWSQLRKASYQTFPYRLRYVHIEANQSAQNATLRTYRERLS